MCTYECMCMSRIVSAMPFQLATVFLLTTLACLDHHHQNTCSYDRI